MNRGIQTNGPSANRKQMDFIQAILEKYGMTRRRSRFQSLILRQHPLLLTEPEAVKPADTIVNNIHTLEQTHFHYSVYSPYTQVMAAGPGQASRITHNIQGDGRAGIGSRTLYPGKQDTVKSEGHPPAGNQNLIQILQERVRKQLSDKHPVTTINRTFVLAKSAVEPVPAQPAVRSREHTAAPSWGVVQPKPPVTVGAGAHAEQRRENGQGPYSAAPQRDIVSDKALQQLSTAHQQLQTLRKLSLHPSIDAAAAAQPERQPPELAEMGFGQTKRPEWVLKRNLKAVPGIAGTTVEAQQSTPAMIFRPNAGYRPLITPVIQLGLGPELTAALERRESSQGLPGTLQAASAGVRLGMLEPPSESLHLLLTAPSEPVPLNKHNLSVRLSGAIRAAQRGAGFPGTVESGLDYNAIKTAPPSLLRGRRPGSMLLTAGTGQEELVQPAGGRRNLILRKPQEPKAAQPEPVQQRPDPFLQEQAAPFPSRSIAKAAASAVIMDTAELNQLAERVYQVLEKRMAIRNDRRGLR